MRTPRASSSALGPALLAAVAAAYCTGCPSLGLHQGTEPVAKGKYQLGASAGGALLYDVPQEQRTPAPSVELSLRRGVADDADVQLKLYTLGVDVGAKYRVLRGDWSMAVLPMLGASRFGDTTTTTRSLYIWGHLPLLVGRRLSPSAQINFGPRMLYGYFFPASGGSAQGLSVGGFFNVEMRMSDRVRLVPEFSLLAALGGDVPVRGWSAYLGPGLLFDF